MDDKTYNAQKRRLKKLGAKWLHCLGLGWWKIDAEYDRHGADFPPPQDGWREIAAVYAKWQFRQARIVWNMPALPRLTDEELETHFVHECGHILICEMRECSTGSETDHLTRHEERVVIGIVNALFWTWEAGAKATKLAMRKGKRKRR